VDGGVLGHEGAALPVEFVDPESDLYLAGAPARQPCRAAVTACLSEMEMRVQTGRIQQPLRKGGLLRFDPLQPRHVGLAPRQPAQQAFRYGRPQTIGVRSEERRVGNEGRVWW